ncbi:hypothetical protein [Enterococcus sp. DIV0170]|uniref:hypothetical protein n=1 Tax=Enterococcus sp. DIV0170 TaxID=2774642 RepID=UPI003F6847CE
MHLERADSIGPRSALCGVIIALINHRSSVIYDNKKTPATLSIIAGTGIYISL